MQTLQNAYKMVTEDCGHHMALTEHRFNELNVNETGTYGFHCPKNTQGFKIKANKEFVGDMCFGVC